jgi:hypothetical protein
MIHLSLLPTVNNPCLFEQRAHFLRNLLTIFKCIPSFILNLYIFKENDFSSLHVSRDHILEHLIPSPLTLSPDLYRLMRGTRVAHVYVVRFTKGRCEINET